MNLKISFPQSRYSLFAPTTHNILANTRVQARTIRSECSSTRITVICIVFRVADTNIPQINIFIASRKLFSTRLKNPSQMLMGLVDANKVGAAFLKNSERKFEGNWNRWVRNFPRGTQTWPFFCNIQWNVLRLANVNFPSVIMSIGTS